MSENPEKLPAELPEEPAPEEETTEGVTPAEAGSQEEIFAEEPAAPPELPPHPERSLNDTPGDSPADMGEVEGIKEPSRFQVFLRRALTWFGVVFVAFLAGFLTFYFVLHQPKTVELERVQGELENAQAEISSLQSQLDDATSHLALLDEATQHRTLLQVMVDVYDARLALTEENVVAAKSALADTPNVLKFVLSDIEAFDSDLASTLPGRLDLIIANLDRDVETAIADCDQLIEDLLEVETALYK